MFTLIRKAEWVKGLTFGVRGSEIVLVLVVVLVLDFWGRFSGHAFGSNNTFTRATDGTYRTNGTNVFGESDASRQTPNAKPS